MMRRTLFATAVAACACLLCAPATAGTLDSYPVVTPGASDKLCGYANAAGHATQCATAQTVANLAQPAGGAGQVQWNNGSVFAGASTMTYCPTCNGGGPLFALTTPLTITNQTFTLNNGSVSWLQGIATGAGGQIFMSTGTVLQWANTVGLSYDTGGVLDLGNSTVGNKTGQLNLGILDATTQISTPDGGSFSPTLDDAFVPIRIRGGAGGQSSPTMLTGSGALYVDGSTAHWLNNAHTVNAKFGLSLQGSTTGSCVTITGVFCYDADLTLQTASGVAVASVEDQGNWFAVGISRFLICPAQGDQGCAVQGTDYISQLLLNDAVSGGTYAEPQIVFQTGNEVSLWGMGQAAPGVQGTSPSTGLANMIRIGGLQDLNTGWDDRSPWQPDLGLEGCLQLGAQNGSASAASGGVGVTWAVAACDIGGIATLENTGKTATAPIKVSFERPTPTTVSGLATADTSPADGDAAFVTDATACVFMSAVTGGGSTHCPVHYDGSSSSWKAG